MTPSKLQSVIVNIIETELEVSPEVLVIVLKGHDCHQCPCANI